jgi:hypothetical protein
LEQRGGYKPILMAGDGEEMYLELFCLFGYEVISLHPTRCISFPLFYSLTNSLCFHTPDVKDTAAQCMHDWHSPHQISIPDYLYSCQTAQYFGHLFEHVDIKLRGFFILLPPIDFGKTFSSLMPLLQYLNR